MKRGAWRLGCLLALGLFIGDHVADLDGSDLAAAYGSCSQDVSFDDYSVHETIPLAEPADRPTFLPVTAASIRVVLLVKDFFHPPRLSLPPESRHSNVRRLASTIRLIQPGGGHRV